MALSVEDLANLAREFNDWNIFDETVRQTFAIARSPFDEAKIREFHQYRPELVVTLLANDGLKGKFHALWRELDATGFRNAYKEQCGNTMGLRSHAVVPVSTSGALAPQHGLNIVIPSQNVVFAPLPLSDRPRDGEDAALPSHEPDVAALPMPVPMAGSPSSPSALQLARIASAESIQPVVPATPAHAPENDGNRRPRSSEPQAGPEAPAVSSPSPQDYDPMEEAARDDSPAPPSRGSSPPPLARYPEAPSPQGLRSPSPLDLDAVAELEEPAEAVPPATGEDVAAADAEIAAADDEDEPAAGVPLPMTQAEATFHDVAVVPCFLCQETILMTELPPGVEDINYRCEDCLPRMIDGHDNICAQCHHGHTKRALILCKGDGCPRSGHASCFGIEDVKASWFCHICRVRRGKLVTIKYNKQRWPAVQTEYKNAKGEYQCNCFGDGSVMFVSARHILPYSAPTTSEKNARSQNLRKAWVEAALFREDRRSHPKTPSGSARHEPEPIFKARAAEAEAKERRRRQARREARRAAAAEGNENSQPSLLGKRKLSDAEDEAVHGPDHDGAVGNDAEQRPGQLDATIDPPSKRSPVQLEESANPHDSFMADDPAAYDMIHS